jgi:hypothetical protein
LSNICFVHGKIWNGDCVRVYEVDGKRVKRGVEGIVFIRLFVPLSVFAFFSFFCKIQQAEGRRECLERILRQNQKKGQPRIIILLLFVILIVPSHSVTITFVDAESSAEEDNKENNDRWEDG